MSRRTTPYPFHRFRRWVALSVSASLALAAAAVILANVLAARLDITWSLPRSRSWDLSPSTQALLSRLDSPLEVVLLTSRHPRLRAPLGDLAAALTAASDWVRVEDLDPLRHVQRVEDLATRFGLTDRHAGLLIYRDRTHPLALADVLAMVDPDGAEPAAAPGFRGEEAVVAGLHNLLQTRRPAVYFLQGHGELDFGSFDAQRGASVLARELQRHRLDLRRLDLRVEGKVPADADCVVIAGPREPMTPAEAAILQGYADRNGRVLLLLDPGPATGLESLLADWGAGLEQGWVVDPHLSFTEAEVVVRDYGSHPVTQGLDSTTTVFFRPRTIRLNPSAGTPRVDRAEATVLVEASERSWLEKDPLALPARLEPERGDVPGPLPLAVAIQRGARQIMDSRFPSSRMVLVGNAEFVANQGLARGGAGNARLVVRSLNWLLDRELSLEMAPRRLGADRIVMSQDQRRALFVRVFLIIPGAVTGFGLLVWARRKA